MMEFTGLRCTPVDIHTQSRRTDKQAHTPVQVALLVAPESCRGTLSAAVTTLVNDERAYGEARLAGVEAQLSTGDRSGCGKVASALAWRDSETRQGPGAWAESAAGRIRGVCR